MIKTRLCGYDKKAEHLHCFACDEKYDLLDLVKLDYGITDNKEAKKKICEIFNIQDAQYIQNISNKKDIKHKQDIPKDAKVIQFNPQQMQKQEQEQPQAKQYDFTKVIQSIYDAQTEADKQHFKDRRTYRRDNRSL